MHALLGGSSVLAHQGGWDEIALVVGPLLILWALLVLANRRARKLNASQDAEADDATG